MIRQLAIAIGIFFITGIASASLKCDQLIGKVGSGNTLNTPLSKAIAMEKNGVECMQDEVFLVKLANLYAQAGDFGNADRIINDGLALHPEFGELQDRQAWLAYERGDAATAKRLADAAIRSRPNAPTAYWIYASIASAKQDWDGVLKNAQRAYEITGDPLMLLVIAGSLHQLDRHADAVKFAYQALKERPTLISNKAGINEAIYSLVSLGRKDEAVELIKKRMAAVPNWREDPALVHAAVVLKVIEPDKK